MTNTPSAFKIANGNEFHKIVAKTGYNQVFKNQSNYQNNQDFIEQPGAKGITILRGSHINPSFTKHIKGKSNLLIS